MGIRYYAYAFDADLAEQAVDDPHSILSSDPRLLTRGAWNRTQA